MKGTSRLFALFVVAAGAVLLGYAVSEGFRRGFGFDLEYGNWDPVIAAAVGAAEIAAGALAYGYFGRRDAGLRRRAAFLAALRRGAVWILVACRSAGVAGGVYGFIMALTLSHAGLPAGWAFGLVVCGVVAWASSSALLPWARGPRAAAKETTVAPFDDRDG